MSRKAVTRAAAAAAIVLTAAAAWLVLAPRELGGSTAYAIVYGTSMEPHLHGDDFVVVRAAADYRVGDAVLYRNRQLHRAVLHRIIAIRNGLYVIKGDNNAFVDSPPARRSEIVGRLWVRVPAGGRIVNWARAPLHAALVVGLLVLFVSGGSGRNAVGRRRRSEAERGAPRARRVLSVRDVPERLLVAGLGVAAASAVACLALAAVSLPRSDRRVVPVEQFYGQSGRFSYGAAAPVSAAYPEGRVRTGDAVFPKLVSRVSVAFDYRFRSARPHGVAGTASLDAVLSDGQGWRRTLVLEPPTAFTGDRTRVEGTIRLPVLNHLIAGFVHETGSDTGAYVLSVKPRIAVRGVVQGRPIEDDLSGSLLFHVSPLRFELLPAANAEAPNPLTVSRWATGATTTSNPLELAGFSLQVARAREIGLGGLAAAAALAGLFGWLLLRSQRRDEEARIRSRYGGWIVDVARRRPRDSEWTVGVADFESLLRLAERYERMILREEGSSGAVFVVEEEGVAYCYAPSGVSALSTRPPSRHGSNGNGAGTPAGKLGSDGA